MDVPANRTATPRLVLVRGLPGSGKSYLAVALQEALGAVNVVMLDPDATDYTSQAYLTVSQRLTAEGVDATFHPYRFLRSQAWQGITDGKTIIWNQAFTNLDGFQKTVVNLQNYAIGRGLQLPVLVVEVEINHAIAKGRVAHRAAGGGHDVDNETFERFIRDYHSFAGEGYHTVTVDGAADIQTSVKKVVQALKTI